MTTTTTFEALQRYQPDELSVRDWARARGSAIEAVMATSSTTNRRAIDRLSALVKFLAWHPMWERSSAPVLALLLTTSHLNSFVSSVNAHRATRTHLYKIGSAIGTMRLTSQLSTKAVSATAEAFWTTVVGFGPLSSLVAAYRQQGHMFAPGVFGGFVERLATSEWDLDALLSGKLFTNSLSELDGNALSRGALALSKARDTVPSDVDEMVRRTSVTAEPTKPLSRTAAVRSAKAQQTARDAAAVQRESGVVTEPALAELCVLDESVAAAMNRFRPYRMLEAEWELAREATMHFTHAYEPPSARWIETRMGAFARFCVWVRRRPERTSSATPLRVVELLEEGLIDHYLAGPLATSPDASRATVRSILRRGVRNLAPHLASPRIGYDPVQPPYAPKECAAFVRLAQNQPTSVTRRGLSSIVSLGLGAGLSSQEQRTVAPSSIFEVDLGGGVVALFVRVHGLRARTVVVRSQYEELLREALNLHRSEGRGVDQPLYGGSLTRSDVTTPVTNKARTALGTGIELNSARLRSTWLVACMSAPVPLGALLRASGLRSARTLVDLVGYCPEPDESAIMAALHAMAATNSAGVAE